MLLEDVLKFIRNSDGDVWRVLLQEMSSTRKNRDLAVAKHFAVGDVVVCDYSEVDEPITGRIEKIVRGRFTLITQSDDPKTPPRIGVPASLCRRA